MWLAVGSEYLLRYIETHTVGEELVVEDVVSKGGVHRREALRGMSSNFRLYFLYMRGIMFCQNPMRHFATFLEIFIFKGISRFKIWL